jgi:hypothetical protein
VAGWLARQDGHHFFSLLGLFLHREGAGEQSRAGELERGQGAKLDSSPRRKEGAKEGGREGSKHARVEGLD